MQKIDFRRVLAASQLPMGGYSQAIMTSTSHRSTTDHSPWYLAAPKPLFPALHSDQTADVLIIGGGIAGVASAYFILQETGRSCVLLEAGRIAAGATGHNAGQAINGIETDLKALKAAIGSHGVSRAFEAGDVGRRLLLGLLDDFNLPCGYVEVPTISLFRQRRLLSWQIRRAIDFQQVRNTAVPLYVASKAFSFLPKSLRAFVTQVSQARLSSILGSSYPEIMGAAFYPPSLLLNTADLTRSLLVHLSQAYETRLKVFEESPAKYALRRNEVFEVECLDFKICAKSVVLATNGYDVRGSGFRIPPIKSIVQGCLGYVSNGPHPLTAVGFSLPGKSRNYFYANTRHFSESSFLTVTGGPPGIGLRQENAAAVLQADFDELIRRSPDLGVSRNQHPRFKWKGILAYLPDGLRWIGADAENPSLYYNIGCNGIGILLSIFGGYAIARQMRGEVIQTVFLPR